MKTTIGLGFDARTNHAPSGYKMPEDFAEFLSPLHNEFTPRQQVLAAHRREILENSHLGILPDYHSPGEATWTKTTGGLRRATAPSKAFSE
jgi:hypothetical protein